MIQWGTVTTTLVALLFRPLVALLFLGLVVLPITLALARVIPEGRVKEILYKKRTAWWDMPLLPRRNVAGNGRSRRPFQ